MRVLVYYNFLKEVRLGGWGQTRKCVRYYPKVACTTFVRALVYCNIPKEVRLGGWGQTRKCVRYYS